MKKNITANSALGKFHSRASEQITVDNHFIHSRDSTMGGKSSSCCGLPFVVLGVYSLIAPLAIAVLGVLLHSCSAAKLGSILEGKDCI